MHTPLWARFRLIKMGTRECIDNPQQSLIKIEIYTDDFGIFVGDFERVCAPATGGTRKEMYTLKR